MEELDWYLMHCDPRRDRQVERLLSLHGFETFAPLIPKTRSRNGNKPLFPGYVFTRLNLDRGDAAATSRLPGVRGLVEIGGGPCSVHASAVSAVRQRVQSGVFRTPDMKPGDRVRVINGPFVEFEG